MVVVDGGGDCDGGEGSGCEVEGMPEGIEAVDGRVLGVRGRVQVCRKEVRRDGKEE